MTTETIHETVRQHYADAAVRASQGSSCCSDPETIGANLYSALERDELPDAAVLASLGCGNPTAVADLHPGERVLDLGSGGGIDVLLSAKRVGPTGRAFGVDMTDEMLALAQANAAQAGATNVEFLKGHIEAHPAAGRVDRRRHQQLRRQPRRRQARGLRRDRPRPAAGRPDRHQRHRRRGLAQPRAARRARLLRRLHRGRPVGLGVPRGPRGGRPDRRHDHAVAHGHRRDDQRDHQGDRSRPMRDRSSTSAARRELLPVAEAGGAAAAPAAADADAPSAACPVRRSPARDLAALILAATCWGVGTVISKAALAEIPPFTLLADPARRQPRRPGGPHAPPGDLVPDRGLAAARPARPPQPGSRLRARPARADHDHGQPVRPAVGARAADDPVPGRPGSCASGSRRPSSSCRSSRSRAWS